MPFTPSHVAAVLPFISSPRLRRYADPWALALGAMVPDLPIFLPFLPARENWHTPLGIVTIDLASVLIALALFHGLFRDPLISLLPPVVSGRVASLAPSMREVAARPLPLVVGGLVGASTHVLWDSFTHSGAPELWAPWFAVSVLGVIRLFRLLQYVSSVVGLALVGWWAWRGLSRMPVVPVPERLRVAPSVRWTVLGAGAAGMVAGAFVWPTIDEPAPHLGIASVITKTGAGTLIGLCLVLTCYAAVWQFRRLVAVSEGA
ncbi:DUF4184 family protein [Nonomuraea sp. NN258]|uniref:DUF4184 family protein n=1 Tax=Nonomuraea antri TaxID=2730852 RepID=UPI0015696A01|nr:DUF4184 family protein [Nonomuraea antri]NRQ36779.1 DUF4184 family protein [Nonomuraea antri]